MIKIEFLQTGVFQRNITPRILLRVTVRVSSEGHLFWNDTWYLSPEEWEKVKESIAAEDFLYGWNETKSYQKIKEKLENDDPIVGPPGWPG